MDGALILDKPEGMTSHSAVLRVRRLLGEPHIGHLGTLDPMATGVLVLLLGKATRLARFYKDRDKTYQGAIRFGFSTDTYDRTGAPTSPALHPVLEPEILRSLFREFTGSQWQQPPPVSAKKVAGVRAYRLARKGSAPQLAALPVTVHELELQSLDGDLAAFRARVSAGTYLRSLAHDLGTRLGCGAHLHSLRRTAVAEFTERQAIRLEELEARSQGRELPLLTMEVLLPEFPPIVLSDAATTLVRHGAAVVLECEAKLVKLLSPSRELIAIAEQQAGESYHPMVVLRPA